MICLPQQILRFLFLGLMHRFDALSSSANAYWFYFIIILLNHYIRFKSVDQFHSLECAQGDQERMWGF